MGNVSSDAKQHLADVQKQFENTTKEFKKTTGFWGDEETETDASDGTNRGHSSGSRREFRRLCKNAAKVGNLDPEVFKSAEAHRQFRHYQVSPLIAAPA